MGKKSKIRNEYNELRQLFKDMQKRKKKYDDSEDRFEDDPRAAKEIEYGRVIRKPTLISKDSVFD
jgi:predicted patatin/cPLA2 family phospholipase|tara:strand:- start:58 stop:252 length:195 start_codon:yes stop_codon:yes gene_type:complete